MTTEKEPNLFKRASQYAKTNNIPYKEALDLLKPGTHQVERPQPIKGGKTVADPVKVAAPTFVGNWSNWHKDKKQPVFQDKLVPESYLSLSNLLLIHDSKRGVIPGLAMRYDDDVISHAFTAKKGDIVFTDQLGNKLDHVQWYYDIKGVKVPEKVKQQVSTNKLNQ